MVEVDLFREVRVGASADLNGFLEEVAARTLLDRKGDVMVDVTPVAGAVAEGGCRFLGILKSFRGTPGGAVRGGAVGMSLLVLTLDSLVMVLEESLNVFLGAVLSLFDLRGDRLLGCLFGRFGGTGLWYAVTVSNRHGGSTLLWMTAGSR